MKDHNLVPKIDSGDYSRVIIICGGIDLSLLTCNTVPSLVQVF